MDSRVIACATESKQGDFVKKNNLSMKECNREDLRLGYGRSITRFARTFSYPKPDKRSNRTERGVRNPLEPVTDC